MLCGHIEATNESFESSHEQDALYKSLEYFYMQYNPIHGYISAFLCTTGALLNVANIIVLTRPSMLSCINVILTAVACCDIGLMVSYLIFIFHTVLSFTSRCEKFQHWSWAMFHLIHANFSIYAHTLSLYLTVAMALARFLILRQPRKTLLSTTRAGIYISIAVSLAILLLCIPTFMTFEIFAVQSDCSESASETKPPKLEQIYVVDFAEEGLCNVSFWMNGVIFKIVPCFLLCVFMALLFHVLLQAAKRHRRLLRPEDSSNSGDRTTLMLTLIVLVFLLTELPQGILTLLSGVLGASFYDNVYKSLGDILDLSSLINSAVNFILYCSMSHKFRQVFYEIFCPAFLRQAKKVQTAESACCSKSTSRLLGEQKTSVVHAAADDNL